MVYNNNFVACIKVDNQILREQKEVVALPFGSEYSIYLKNQNSVRAIVRVSIDGQNINDASDGWFIIGANDTLELERFIRNGNLNKGNRFKYIERTAQIEEHRGIGSDDGLVRVEYKFEIPNVFQTWSAYYQPAVNTNSTISTTKNSTTQFRSAFRSDEINAMNSAVPTENCLRSMESHINMCSVQDDSLDDDSFDFNDAGITVAGAESNQKFSYGSWFPTESTSQVIVLKLVGQVGDVAVKQPVTVQQKPVCTTCGKVNKATFKFCGRCGTALVLFG